MKPALWNGGGGDEEDRTPDLGIANAALSQLSYVPTNVYDTTALVDPKPAAPPAGGRAAAALWQTQHSGCNTRLRHAPHDANRATRFPGWPCRGSRKDHGRSHAPSPIMPRISLMPAASAASRRSSHAAACGWSAGRRWVRRQPRRPPGRSHGRYAPRLPGLPPDP